MIPDDPLPRGTSQTAARVSDYADWLTKADAATRIGVSTKAIERFAQAGKLQQAFRPQAGSPDVRVYHPDDVARLAQERQPAPLPPFLVPSPAEQPTNGKGALAVAGPSAVRNPESTHSGEDLLRVLVTAARQILSETSQTPTLYLTVDEAAALLNWTPRDLRWEIREGRVPCRRPNQRDWRTWRIRRKDLEAL